MKHIHFLGIAGSGASAAAAIARSQGFEVSGCDASLEGHSPKHLANVDILAVTPAIFSLDSKNPELLAAKERGIPVMTWQEFMGEYLEKDKFVIAVCGTHGKSTTTALVGTVMEDGGLDPTVELGAVVPKWGQNYRIGNSTESTLSKVEGLRVGYFVTEADEFNDNFLVSHPDITVLTSVEFDHPEYFADFEAYKKSFIRFLNQTKKLIIANLSDPGVRQVLETYQKGKENPSNPEIIDYSKTQILFPLQIPGEHNKLNAAAALQVGLALGIAAEKIQKSLADFSGLSRRFELVGEKNGVKVYSDFAHNPGKIKAALKTVRQEFPDKKIWVIFQPHMFSRTKVLFPEFVEVLKSAPINRISIIDIYPSREVDTGQIHSKELSDAVGVEYLPKSELSQIIQRDYQNFDILFFVGAGDIDDFARELI